MARALLVPPLSETPVVDLRNTAAGSMTAGNVVSAPGQFFTWTSVGLTMGFSSANAVGTEGASARYFPPADVDVSGADTLYVETEWPVDCQRPFLQVFIGADAGATYTNYITSPGFLVAYGADSTKSQPRTIFAFRLSECAKFGSAITDVKNVTRAVKKFEFRMRSNTTVTDPQTMRVIRIWGGRASRSKCVISYDNIFASVYTTAWGTAGGSGWRGAGFPGVMFMSETDLADVGASMTAAQVQELYAAGWDVGLQNSDDSNSVYVNRAPVGGLTASGTTATWVNHANLPHLLIPGDTIVVTGSTPAAYNGAFVVQTTPNAFTFTYTMLSAPAISPAIGGLITCRRPGFDSEAAIVADVAKSRAVARSNGWTRGNEFFAYSNGLYSEDVCRWMDSAGCYLSRTTNFGASLQRKAFDLRLSDPLARHALPAINMDNNTAANVLADIDQAILIGQSFVLFGHGVQTVADSLNMATAEFTQLVTGVKARVNQGLMDVVTMTQLRQQMEFARILV